MTNRPNGNPNPYPPPFRHPHYTTSSSSSASLKGCCCCIFLLLTFLALLAIALALVILLVVKPHKPQFDLNQVSVQYLLVTSSPSPDASSPSLTSNPYLSLNITLLFTASNPNKVGIRYESTDFEVMYRGIPLGLAVVPGFEQQAHSTRMVKSTVTVDRFDVTQAGALDLVRDATVNDRVELRITGDVGAKILVMGISSPRVQVSVDCVIVISPKKQSVTYKQCGVDGVNL